MTAPSDQCSVEVHVRGKGDDEPMLPTEADRYHLRYWAQCGCGHTGPARSEENTAAEDGHDHAFPGWRGMPILCLRPNEGKAAIIRWEAEARRAYPAGWFERGGPVLTRRRPPADRHVPGRAPEGGYDIARAGTPPAPGAPAPKSEQQALFAL